MTGVDDDWRALAVGGAVAGDGAGLNHGFPSLWRGHPTAPPLVCHPEPIRPDLRRHGERGAFAILRKPVGLPTDFSQ